MGIRRSIVAAAVLLLAVVLPFDADAASGNRIEAAAFVEKLSRDAIEVLATPGVTSDERRKRYRDLLDNGFAVKTIGRYVVGRYWRTATPEQRKRYLDLYRSFVLDAYTARLDGYSGQSFKVVKTLPINDRDTLVSTEIIPNTEKSDAPAIRVDYRVRERDGTLKIIDVMVEGVSLIATQRSEFASVINREGFEGLIELLGKREEDAKTSN